MTSVNRLTGRLQDITRGAPGPFGPDDFFMFGQYFEAAVSIAILDQPGAIGDVYDRYCSILADVLQRLKDDPEVANRRVKQVRPYTETTLLSAVVDALLMPFSPLSDQPGACLDENMKKALADRLKIFTEPEYRQEVIRDFMKKEGLDWLLKELRTPCWDPGYTYTHLLTKIKAIGAFGSILWEYLRDGPGQFEDATFDGSSFNTAGSLCELLRESNPALGDIEALRERFDEFRRRTRTPLFDRPTVRLASGDTWTTLEDRTGKKTWRWFLDGAPVGWRVGIHNLEGRFLNPYLCRLIAQRFEAPGGGLAGDDVPVSDLVRSGPLSRLGQEYMPPGFRRLGLPEALAGHVLEPGSGINMWERLGVYPYHFQRQELLHTPGSPAGGAFDVLLGLNSLSDTSLYGAEDTVMPATAGMSAFLSFSGLQPFEETFPIGHCMAADIMGDQHTGGLRPHPAFTTGQRLTLYRHVTDTLILSDQVHASMTAVDYIRECERLAGELIQARTLQHRIAMPVPPAAYEGPAPLQGFDEPSGSRDEPSADDGPSPADHPGAPLIPEPPPQPDWSTLLGLDTLAHTDTPVPEWAGW
ncbi:hypothetical protein AB0D49_29105 [Streptomyces sp. NPDC048290]|uniref:hypothetical protein n=1 Tax=Streptomyces sp. NPDC048290 TaxID=3155811 RepID=UPI0034378018